MVARLLHLQPNLTADYGTNATLDALPAYFPLNQSVYADFTHDDVIVSVIAAMGLTQFAEYLPPSGPPVGQQFISSQMVPFGSRFYNEIISCTSSNGTTSTYVHSLLNQRTIPLGRSIPACGNRTDGWCPLQTFIAYQQNQTALAQYEYNCFASYSVSPSATITNGVGPNSPSPTQ